ncbi:uncharacterized protein BO80DRAFT_492027 [Aspergillus ibericus CBS 121593]|uniref:Uncharacterized protein n=1 Tax=Aspergillus ibericus CBS 121593 TaxID=1448316 RepID=A0A395H6R4_9EURO|nr:hypothetical protein BO80DRAFT_492027 [Aspergillus ibericus CBS 121593]RAL03306.1 hypothetical protein BO80DRAFT_492027 [Aspergillus ibericus CBS 121593]
MLGLRRTPAPYNDPSAWGIVPGWGLATITASTLPNRTPGTTLWGYWPPLVPHHTHFIETSPHRQSLMSLYNRYIVFDIKDRDLDSQAWESVRVILSAGYLFSEYVFAYDPATHPVTAPFPGRPGVEWTAAEADLFNAVVISLAASGKTARSVAVPLGLLQVTSVPGVIGDAGMMVWRGAEEWLVERKPEKLVVVDFGGRDGVHQNLFGLIQRNEVLRGSKLVVLGVGFQQKVYTMEEALAGQNAMQQLGMIQFNMSPILDAVLGVRDPVKVFEELDERWKHWLANRKLFAPDLRLRGWDLLAQSEVKPDEVLVYRV